MAEKPMRIIAGTHREYLFKDSLQSGKWPLFLNPWFLVPGRTRKAKRCQTRAVCVTVWKELGCCCLVTLTKDGNRAGMTGIAAVGFGVHQKHQNPKRQQRPLRNETVVPVNPPGIPGALGTLCLLGLQFWL